MGIDYVIDPARLLVHVRCDGTITLEVILDYERRIINDPAFDPSFAELFDLRGATTLDVSFDEIDNLVEFEKAHDRYVGTRRCAFVAPADINFGTARMYEMMGSDSPMTTQVFRELEEALEWLGVPPPDDSGC